MVKEETRRVDETKGRWVKRWQEDGTGRFVPFEEGDLRRTKRWTEDGTGVLERWTKGKWVVEG